MKQLLLWDAVAQWLERATDNRMVAVRILLRPFGNFGNFLYPTLPMSMNVCVYEDLHGKK